MIKRNIVLLITDLGSFHNFLKELSVELSKFYQLHVICSSNNTLQIQDKSNIHQQNIHFYFVDIPRSFSIFKELLASFRIFRLVSKIKPEIIHAHFTTGIFPCILFKYRKANYIGTFHGLGMNSTKGPKQIIFSIIELICFTKLDKIILINNKDFNLVKRIFPLKAYRLSEFGVGCDLVKFNPHAISELDKLKSKLKIGIVGKFVITFVGRFVEFKGFDLVVEVFTALNKKYPNKFSLILVGGIDPIHNTGLVNNELYNNCDSIINVGFSSEVHKFLALTDLFFFPSKKEGLPVSVMEALSMGVPILSFEERGILDLVSSGKNGILIKSNSKKEDALIFFETIETLFLNRDILIGLSKNCLLERDKYSRSFFVQDHIKFYSNILEKN